MKVLFAAIIMFVAAGAQAENASFSDALSGNWVGSWESARAGGTMEMALEANDSSVNGKVRATNPPALNCSPEWRNLVAISKKGEKIHAEYNLGGRCGKVETIFWLDSTGLTGTWSSQGGKGTFHMVKQVPSSVGTASEVR